MNDQKRFRRPAMLDPAVASQIPGDVDPATRHDLAHATAQLILAGVHGEPDPVIVERAVKLVADQGLDTLAELWAALPAETLPGTLYRLYSLQQWTGSAGQTASLWYRLGMDAAPAANVIAGVVEPPTPEHLAELVDEILSGFFRGDLAVALERAAAYAQVLATGAAFDADSRDVTSEGEGAATTTTAANLSRLAGQFLHSAELWRLGALE